jgi:hypothetical protein
VLRVWALRGVSVAVAVNTLWQESALSD